MRAVNGKQVVSKNFDVRKFCQLSIVRKLESFTRVKLDSVHLYFVRGAYCSQKLPLACMSLVIKMMFDQVKSRSQICVQKSNVLNPPPM
jgi:hypothetical protein